MGQHKIGRNDPCPCGSGKKYKKCCGMLEEIADVNDDAFTRNSKLMTTVKMKLDNYYNTTIKKLRKDARYQFLRFTVNNSLPEEHESIYSDWIWFDLLTQDNITLAYQYLQENANYLSSPLKNCLEALSISYLSVYEVEEISSHYLFVRDIFLDQSCAVLLKEPWEGVDKDTNLLLLGRIVQLDNENLFSGMVGAVENNAGQKDFIIQHMNYIRQTLNDTMENILKAHTEILYGVFDHAFYKTMLNFNEIRGLEISTEESKKLADVLADDKDFVFLHHSEDFDWFKPVRKHHDYVRLALGEKELLCCAEVLEDILYMQEKIMAYLPDKKFSIYSNRFLKQPPPLDKNQLWFMVVKDRDTEKWLDTPLTELENQTPRQLLTADNNKERLLNLLDSFKSTLNNDIGNELINYMQERIKNYNS